MSKSEMLINYVPGEECRIAIVVDGLLEEFYQERASAGSHVGNIYKGKVTNVEPSIQAAFIDFGEDRNGFLHITDLHPSYFSAKHREETEQVGSKTPRHERPPIQQCLKRGQDILVQVLKEGIGTKGPTLTSYLSIPGRFLVMMPQMQRLGVSRKVEDDDARRAMRKILAELKPPEGFGFIIRTAGMGQTKTDLKRDLAYLVRLWKSIERRKKDLRGVGELYTEQDLIIRTIRDVFTNDITRVVIDNPQAAQRAHDFLAIASPRSRPNVAYYHDPVPLFHRFDIERQIEGIKAREAPLKSGGSLVFDQTEALVAIDVNSGKSRSARDAETNAFNTNMEAVDEICRQLRLRDLGGVIVNDLIDMRDLKRRKQVETRFRNNLKNDRARTRVGSISQFGLLEMTRQRMRPSLESSQSSACGACEGNGHVKSPESVVLDVMRRLALVLHRNEVVRAELIISPDAAFQLLNRKRSQLVELEKRYGKAVTVRVGGSSVSYVEIRLFDERGGQMEFDSLSDIRGIAAPTETSFVEMKGDVLPPIDELEFEEEADVPAIELTSYPGPDESSSPDADQDDEDKPAKRKRRRRRRGRGRGSRSEEASEAQSDATQDSADESKRTSDDESEQADTTTVADDSQSTDGEDSGVKKKSRRRRRGGRGRKRPAADDTQTESTKEDVAVEDGSQADREQTQDQASSSDDSDTPAPAKKKRRSRSRKKKPAATADPQDASAEEEPAAKDKTTSATDGSESNDTANPDESGETKSKRPRRRRRRGGKAKADAQAQSDGDASANDGQEKPAPPPVDANTDGGYSNQVVDRAEPVQEPS
jgi:ribonuclease E